MEQIFIKKQVEAIAQRWQIPVDRVEYFIQEFQMPIDDDEARGNWFVAHLGLVKKEQQKAFENRLFPSGRQSETEASLQPFPQLKVNARRSTGQKNGRKQKKVLTSVEEIASRWQLPIATIEYFVKKLGLPLEDDEARGNWFTTHTELILVEQKKHFDDLLFPGKFRPESSEPSA